jgi:serine carboxypeptidase-like clade 2
VDGQVGGYTQGYQGLTFATVRGAGHMVPGTQPDRALAMVQRWTNGDPL